MQQSRKIVLMEGAIGFNDQDQIKGLDRQELRALLEKIYHDTVDEMLKGIVETKMGFNEKSAGLGPSAPEGSLYAMTPLR